MIVLLRNIVCFVGICRHLIRSDEKQTKIGEYCHMMEISTIPLALNVCFVVDQVSLGPFPINRVWTLSWTILMLEFNNTVEAATIDSHSRHIILSIQVLGANDRIRRIRQHLDISRLVRGIHWNLVIFSLVWVPLTCLDIPSSK